VGDLHTPWAYAIHALRWRRRSTEAASDGLTDIVGELTFDPPTALDDLQAIARSCRWCFEAHRVQLVRWFLACNRTRAVLIFRAPDTESVRLACRHLGMPLERIWSCRQDDSQGNGHA
jgi:hypothetical protein